MKIEFKRLGEIDKEEVIALLNLPLVRRHMPLSKDNFDDEDYKAFITAKEKIWTEHGYGPWAFVANNHFIGWGGLQYEEGNADLAIVLHPDYWGNGRIIYEQIIEIAFSEIGLVSITALLPPSRTRIKGMMKLGFIPDGELIIDEEKFLRFRLFNPSKNNNFG